MGWFILVYLGLEGLGVFVVLVCFFFCSGFTFVCFGFVFVLLLVLFLFFGVFVFFLFFFVCFCFLSFGGFKG